jgi:hypothetical protein
MRCLPTGYHHEGFAHPGWLLTVKSTGGNVGLESNKTLGALAGTLSETPTVDNAADDGAS